MRSPSFGGLLVCLISTASFAFIVLLPASAPPSMTPLGEIQGMEEDADDGHNWLPWGLLATAVALVYCVKIVLNVDGGFEPAHITLAQEPLRLRAVKAPSLCAHTLDFFCGNSVPHRIAFIRCRHCGRLPAERMAVGWYHCSICRVMVCDTCLRRKYSLASPLGRPPVRQAPVAV